MVSAELGPFLHLNGTSEKGKTTGVQQVLVPWMIAKYGMSYKSAPLDDVKQMVMAWNRIQYCRKKGQGSSRSV